jgi:DnaJ-class molecular chaperone
MVGAIGDAHGQLPAGSEWCPECNGYGSSRFEESERCTRCGGSGLVAVANPREGSSRVNGSEPQHRPGQ